MKLKHITVCSASLLFCLVTAHAQAQSFINKGASTPPAKSSAEAEAEKKAAAEKAARTEECKSKNVALFSSVQKTVADAKAAMKINAADEKSIAGHIRAATSSHSAGRRDYDALVDCKRTTSAYEQLKTQVDNVITARAGAAEREAAQKAALEKERAAKGECKTKNANLHKEGSTILEQGKKAGNISPREESVGNSQLQNHLQLANSRETARSLSECQSITASYTELIAKLKIWAGSKTDDAPKFGQR